MADIHGFIISDNDLDLTLFDDMLRYGLKKLYTPARFNKLLKIGEGKDTSENVRGVEIMCKIFRQCCLMSGMGCKNMYANLESTLIRLAESGILYEREYNTLKYLTSERGERIENLFTGSEPAVVSDINKSFKNQSAKISEAHILANMLCKFIQDSEADLMFMDSDVIWQNYVDVQNMVYENCAATVGRVTEAHQRLMKARNKAVNADIERKKFMTRYDRAAFKKSMEELAVNANEDANLRETIVKTYKSALSDAFIGLYECIVKAFLKDNVMFLTITADCANSELKHATAYKGSPMDGESQYTLYTRHWDESEHTELSDMICRIIGATVGKSNTLNMFMNQFKLNPLMVIYQYLGANLSSLPAIMEYLRTLTDGSGELWQDWICNTVLDLEIEARRQYKASISELLDGSYFIPGLTASKKTNMSYVMMGNIDQSTVSVVLGDGKAKNVFITINKEYAEKLRAVKKVTITDSDVTVYTNANVADNIWYYLTGRNKPAEANPPYIV